MAVSGTVAAAAKARLVGTSNVLSGLSGLETVTVAYDMPRDPPREIIYGGKIEGPVQPAAMRGGTRIKREENLTLQLYVRVYQLGQKTTESAETRAVALSNLVEDYIAANHTLGDLPNLLLAQVVGVDLDGFLEDDGATAQVTLAVALKSFLT